MSSIDINANDPKLSPIHIQNCAKRVHVAEPRAHATCACQTMRTHNYFGCLHIAQLYAHSTCACPMVHIQIIRKAYTSQRCSHSCAHPNVHALTYLQCLLQTIRCLMTTQNHGQFNKICGWATRSIPICRLNQRRSTPEFATFFIFVWCHIWSVCICTCVNRMLLPTIQQCHDVFLHSLFIL